MAMKCSIQLVQPAGIRNDGRANFYHRFTIKAGTYQIIAKLKDQQDFDDYKLKESKQITLKSGGGMVNYFDPEKRKIIIVGANKN